jgi:DNA-binding beta-propeller fold protein YncE
VCAITGARTHTIDPQTVGARPPVTPEGVAWHDATTRLYVTEPDAGRIVVFNVRL